jgi:ribosomal protein S18 acetylase RimI-like enzyme
LAKGSSLSSNNVGKAVANINPLEKIFIEKTRLHLSAIYTVPDARRQGVARQLIQKVLEWGKQMNAEEADLNVLAANPAWNLYKKLGFDLHEVSLVKKLE